ncbi:MAG: HAMP domain-containing histidine kinase [Candidatus Latescibacterota bacterium]|nr:MAG: HAMP domain-containing histidine kinase [Candidatus Latescibacterota bacterium]
MSFRARLLIAFLIAALLPVIVLAFLIRSEMTGRLSTQYEGRVETLIAVIESDLATQSDAIAAALAVLRSATIANNRFRNAAVDGNREERPYLLDYAGEAMALARLSMLQIQDGTGRIITSGHFRNEFDRLEPELPRLLTFTTNGTALVQARAPDGHFLALARVDSFEIASKSFYMVGGVRVGPGFLERLTRDDDVKVELVYPGGIVTSQTGEAGSAQPRAQSNRRATDPSDSSVPDGGNDMTYKASATDAIVRALDVQFIDSKRRTIEDAEFRVAHQLDDLRRLRRSIDRWFLVSLSASVLLVIALVSWTASRISRPLVELAEKTSAIDLDRLDIDFDTQRKDEIGGLSRLLGAMTKRLRASAIQIKEAERRATLGELARQVNHDIKNGLTPIRNVFRHLTQLAAEDPARLPTVFKERQQTLDSSMEYLADLASNYARLTPRTASQRCDVNAIARQVVTDIGGSKTGSVDIRTDLKEGAVVVGDPVALRRILENLIDNAIDSLESAPGSVGVATSVEADDPNQPMVRLTVTDTGRGLDSEHRAKVFDDFYTTKANGTGLGLSIVRRLVMDLGGSIELESEINRGTRVVVNLPRAS